MRQCGKFQTNKTLQKSLSLDGVRRFALDRLLWQEKQKRVRERERKIKRVCMEKRIRKRKRKREGVTDIHIDLGVKLFNIISSLK